MSKAPSPAQGDTEALKEQQPAHRRHIYICVAVGMAIIVMGIIGVAVALSRQPSAQSVPTKLSTGGSSSSNLLDVLNSHTVSAATPTVLGLIRGGVRIWLPVSIGVVVVLGAVLAAVLIVLLKKPANVEPPGDDNPESDPRLDDVVDQPANLKFKWWYGPLIGVVVVISLIVTVVVCRKDGRCGGGGGVDQQAGGSQLGHSIGGQSTDNQLTGGDLDTAREPGGPEPGRVHPPGGPPPATPPPATSNTARRPDSELEFLEIPRMVPTLTGPPAPDFRELPRADPPGPKKSPGGGGPRNEAPPAPPPRRDEEPIPRQPPVPEPKAQPPVSTAGDFRRAYETSLKNPPDLPEPTQKFKYWEREGGHLVQKDILISDGRTAMEACQRIYAQSRSKDPFVIVHLGPDQFVDASHYEKVGLDEFLKMGGNDKCPEQIISGSRIPAKYCEPLGVVDAISGALSGVALPTFNLFG